MPAKQTKSTGKNWKRAKLRSIAAKKGWKTRRKQPRPEWVSAAVPAPMYRPPSSSVVLSWVEREPVFSPKPQSVFLDALQWLPRLKAWLRRMVGK